MFWYDQNVPVVFVPAHATTLHSVTCWQSIVNPENVCVMTEERKVTKRKGGRPCNPVKKSLVLSVKCSRLEKGIIQYKAKTAGMSISELLRTLALKGQVDIRVKKLPQQVLAFTGSLNHLSANLNQVAKKRNRDDFFSPLEREELFRLIGELKQFVVDLKASLQ